MMPLRFGAPTSGDQTPPRRRRGFGLDSPMPADRRIVLRAVLRHLAEERTSVVAFRLAGQDPGRGDDDAPVEGPDLLLLAPGGRSVFVTVKPQAVDLARAHRAFADLCRACAVPLVVVRSLPEARRAFDDLKL